MEVEILGEKRKVPVCCKCKTEALEKEKQLDIAKEKMRRLDRLRSYSMMGDKFKSSRFENFKEDENNANSLKIAKLYCENWREMKEEGVGFLFYGEPGVGKSYLSFCVANYLLDRMVPVIAISTIALINKIYESYGKHGEEGEVQIINLLRNADLLVLDDLGAEHSGRQGKEKQIIYSALESRCSENKPTILTTNLSLPQLKNKLTGDDGVLRSFDRLTEMCTPVQITGPSRRVDSARRKQKIIEDLLKS